MFITTTIIIQIIYFRSNNNTHAPMIILLYIKLQTRYIFFKNALINFGSYISNDYHEMGVGC